jgi:hypothetical protein
MSQSLASAGNTIHLNSHEYQQQKPTAGDSFELAQASDVFNNMDSDHSGTSDRFISQSDDHQHGNALPWGGLRTIEAQK